METETLNLTAGDGYSFATVLQRNSLTESAYAVRINAMKNSALSSLYQAEWMARSGTPDETKGTDVMAIGRDATALGKRVAEKTKPAWMLDLYRANIRACRSLSQVNEPARPWMGDFDPYKAQPDYGRIVSGTAVVVTAGVVGVAAAVALATAWWARGQDQARAGVQTETIRQQAAVAAATRVALAYVAQGKDPPPEFLESIALLGGAESARAWAVPLAIAVPLGAVGVTMAWGIANR